MSKRKQQDEHQDEVDGRVLRMKRKPYEAEMRRLHGELVAMQEWVKATGAKICIVFEGSATSSTCPPAARS